MSRVERSRRQSACIALSVVCSLLIPAGSPVSGGYVPPTTEKALVMDRGSSALRVDLAVDPTNSNILYFVSPGLGVLDVHRRQVDGVDLGLFIGQGAFPGAW